MNGTWQTVTLANKTVDVYEPPLRPAFGLLYLHSYGMEHLTDNATFTRLFDELRLGCICPQGQHSWWVDRVCTEFDPQLTAERFLLDHVLGLFASRWGLAPPAVGLMGISMGGQGALRLGFKHPRVFPVVAGISSAIEFGNLIGQGSTLDEMYDSKEQARQDSALLHIHPHEQPPHIFFCIDPADREWFRGNDRLHEKLAALGVAHTCDLTTRHGGHCWEYFDAMADPAIRFVHAGLSALSRRLL